MGSRLNAQVRSQDFDHGGPDLFQRALPVDSKNREGPIHIVRHHRLGSIRVYLQAMPHGIRVIVLPVIQPSATFIAAAIRDRRVRVDVVDTSTLRAAPSTTDTLYEHLIGRFEEQHGVYASLDRGKSEGERLRLGHGARKAIENHAAIRREFPKPLLHERNH
jgi:hypothetical protein